MRRKAGPLVAFVDESMRSRRYLMGCVLVEAKHLATLRVAMGALVLTGGRVHFHNESDGRRRALLAQFAQFPISAFVVVCHRSQGVTEFRARELCLAAIVGRLQSQSVPHLIVESRHDDREDHRTILRARTAEPPMVWEHRIGVDEPLLWIADGITWAVGAGAAWRQLIEPKLTDVIELRP